MITVRLKGGVGNQMFQIAASYALALRNNDIFGLDFNNASVTGQGKLPIKYKTNLFATIQEIDLSGIKEIYIDPKFSYTEIPYKDGLMLDGYFQSEKYFEDFKNEIINLFHLPSATYIKNIISTVKRYGDLPTTSIHIRRGDYLKSPNFHPVCDMEYYKQAMDLIGESHFSIISDDIPWAKKNFTGKNITISEFNDEILDLTVMAMSDNNIIANSSFSWWGAYLNPNQSKKIIAPSKWFGPSGPQDIQDILPNSWIKL